MSLDFAPGYCAECNNSGELDCHCGGDLCVCGQETYPCPACGGFSCDILDDDYDFEEGFDAGEWTETPKVVNVGDELHQVLADALSPSDSKASDSAQYDWTDTRGSVFPCPREEPGCDWPACPSNCPGRFPPGKAPSERN